MNFSKLYTTARSTSLLRAATSAVRRINNLENWATSLDEEGLKREFKKLGSEQGDAQAIKGFALARAAASRVLGMRMFDVQLIGAWTLLHGKLAEMRTGEGKTLTIGPAAALLALAGKGVHVVTANAYLARRDSEIMRPFYEALGLSVGFIDSDMPLSQKRENYQSDITYGVGSEFGFDYLKDNLVQSAEDIVQRPLHAAIVDEVDSILIDEARVPLIIAKSDNDVSEMVNVVDACIKGLLPETHFRINLKERHAELTDEGYRLAEEALVAASVIKQPSALYLPENLAWARALHAAVQALAFYRKDRDYVVQGDELVLVDTGTGRKMPGRRLEGGIHEALEAREALRVQAGTRVQATITYQNYFGMYAQLSGLSGTAATDAEEFNELYGLETVVIPTNKPVRRVDHEDLVYLTKAEKFAAAVALAKEKSLKGNPVLIGCATIRDARVLDGLLTREGVPHETLTAQNIGREAEIVANAGRPGAITVATNMAGRGTDIRLGGEPPAREPFSSDEDFETAHRHWVDSRDKAVAAGGLFVIGTERNGIRRVDNQLAGRSGRQGDPGETQFLMSLEDPLLHPFSKNKKMALVRKLIQSSGSALGGGLIKKLIHEAQASAENQGFSARKSLMKYDDVRSQQRKAVYALRFALLDANKAHHEMVDHLRVAVSRWVAVNIRSCASTKELPLAKLKAELLADFGFNAPLLAWVSKDNLSLPEVAEKLNEQLTNHVRASLKIAPDEARQIFLETLDEAWTSHLSELDELQKNVSLKSHTGLNPMYQFSKDAYDLFQSLVSEVDHQLVRRCFSEEVRKAHDDAKAKFASERSAEQKVALALHKGWVGRNSPCPCESGKRFKDCHGKFNG